MTAAVVIASCSGGGSSTGPLPVSTVTATAAASPTPTSPPTGISGALTEFPLAPNSAPAGIAAGFDGAIWFTESAANRIGRLTVNGGLTEFPLPTPSSQPYGITAGPDGAMWFAESAASKIGRISASGTISEFAIPTFAEAIATGPDGALWYAGYNVGRITTTGAVTEYPLITTYTFGGTTYRGRAYGLAAGPDGAMWFTEFVFFYTTNGCCVVSSKIGRITTAGVMTEIVMADPASGPTDIVAGADGALWFSYGASGYGYGRPSGVGRVSPSGVIGRLR